MELYETSHTPSVPGTQHYRLRQISLGGNDRSQTQQVDFSLDLSAFQVFPNPANQLLFVQAAPYAGHPGQLQISSVTGRILIEKKWDELPVEPFAIDVQHLVTTKQ